MNILIDDVATYLEANGIGTVGQNIFVSFMPVDLTGVAVFDTGGYQNDEYLPIAHATFQIYIREDSYLSARQKADNIVALLQGLNHTALKSGGITPYIILMVGEPNHIGRDERNRDEMTINFRAKYAR